MAELGRVEEENALADEYCLSLQEETRLDRLRAEIERRFKATHERKDLFSFLDPDLMVGSLAKGVECDTFCEFDGVK